MRRLVRRREREGLSYATLSAMSGIPAGTLAWWAHRLRSTTAARSRERRGGSEFVEVIPAERGAAVDYEITLPSGIQVRAPAVVDREELARVVQAILSC